MGKMDQLTAAAQALPDEQLEALIAYAHYLSAEPLYYSAPPEVLESIERGLQQSAAGQSVPAEEAFARLRSKIDS